MFIPVLILTNFLLTGGLAFLGYQYYLSQQQTEKLASQIQTLTTENIHLRQAELQALNEKLFSADTINQVSQYSNLKVLLGFFGVIAITAFGLKIINALQGSSLEGQLAHEIMKTTTAQFKDLVPAIRDLNQQSTNEVVAHIDVLKIILTELTNTLNSAILKVGIKVCKHMDIYHAADSLPTIIEPTTKAVEALSKILPF